MYPTGTHKITVFSNLWPNIYETVEFMATIVPPPFFCRDVSDGKKLRMAQKIMTFEAKVTCFNTHGTGLASMYFLQYRKLRNMV